LFETFTHLPADEQAWTLQSGSGTGSQLAPAFATAWHPLAVEHASTWHAPTGVALQLSGEPPSETHVGVPPTS
jgi:hypothetical protein